MDPSIMKLLEEEEDETMHSGAEVEAFQAALNRDIGGGASTSQPSDSVNVATLSLESNQTSTQPFMNWQATGQDSNAGDPIQQDVKNVQQQLQQEQHALGMDLKDHGMAIENPEQHNDDSQELSYPLDHQKQSGEKFSQGRANQTSLQISQTSGIQISDNGHPVFGIDKMQNSASESQSLKFQNAGDQQATSTEQAGNLKNHGKQIPFILLLPAMKPHLDKDKEMQLQTLFNKLRKNDIAKDDFVQLMRNIVGDQVLRMAVLQLRTQQGLNQPQLQSQTLARQHNIRRPVSGSTSQFTDSRSLNPPSAIQVPTNASHQPLGNSALKPPELENQVDMHAKPMSQMSSSSASMTKQEREQSSNAMQGQNKQHFQFPQTSFPVSGSTGGNYHPYSGTNVNASVSSVKPQSHDLQMRQMSHHQTIGVTQSGGPPQTMNMMSMPKLERQNHVNDPNRVQSGSTSYHTTKPPLQQTSVLWQAPPINKEQTAGTFQPVNYVKQEPVEQASEQKQKTQVPKPLGVPAVELGNSFGGNIRDESLEKQSSKANFSTSKGMMPATSVSPSVGAPLDANVQGSRIPTSAGGGGSGSGRTPPKKPTGGQKKPLEALGSSPPPSSKKQKVSGAFVDQSIEQLNDVTAVSGVNLREEEEQLFSGSKEDNRVSEASRKVVQEEEERLILERIPLQKKLAEIMAKCGLKTISSDVERCLSLCLEERMRGLISNLIRVSKQRVDVEKFRHRTLITSDVRQQIMVMNQKAKEEWEKKQTEAEKLQKVNELEGENKVEGEKEKDESRTKSVKVNKEDDDKMRTNAANVAARAAVGVDDMLSKWQLMAQARQKCSGGADVVTGSLPDKDANHKVLSGRSTKDNPEAERRGSATSVSAGTTRKFGRNQVIVPQMRVTRTISVKDVIAVLEKEPQMSKSTLMYRLYERIQSDAPAE